MRPPLTWLSPDQFKECEKWGRKLIPNLSKYARSRASHGIEDNPAGQSLAKAGEVIPCIVLELGWETALVWEPLPPGVDRPHHDFLAGFQLRWLVDAKQTSFSLPYLFWSKDKTDQLATQKIDILMSVPVRYSVIRNTFGGYIAGWITKKAFLRKKLVADGDQIGPGLDDGTWFVHHADLNKNLSILRTEIDPKRRRQ
jgi:hypothetical protein